MTRCNAQTKRFGIATLVGSFALLVCLAVADGQWGNITRIALSPDGAEGNDQSDGNGVTPDGSFVLFSSRATNLVNEDTGGHSQVYLRDLRNSTTVLVSRATDGTPGNRMSWGMGMSSDGRYVAFASLASNLVPNDTNGVWDIFVHDVVSGTTERVSVSSTGEQANGRSEVSLWNAMSADGRYVVFQSDASNLVPGDSAGWTDIFVRDRWDGTTTRVSVTYRGGQSGGDSINPVISANGRYVAYRSRARNLVPNDTNDEMDVFVYDLQTGAVERVSVSSSGEEANGLCIAPTISADGMRVAFPSLASNLVQDDSNGSAADIFVHDRATRTTEVVSVSSTGVQGPHSVASFAAPISPDGRYVSFRTGWSLQGGRYLRNASRTYVHDTRFGRTYVAALTWDGFEPNKECYPLAFTDSGAHLLFDTGASNVVPNDTNGVLEPFLRKLAPHASVALAAIVHAGVAHSPFQLTFDEDDDPFEVRTVRPIDVAAPSVRVEFTTVAEEPHPTDLTLVVNDRATAGPVLRRIELFNYATGNWDLWDVRYVTMWDTTTEVRVAQGADRYVEGGSAYMRARISYFDVGVNVVSWSALLDSVQWYTIR